MSSLAHAYVPLLRSTRARRLVASALVGRLSITVLDIPLILLVQAQTRSYAIAGLAIAADSVGIAVSAPLRGRALDRLGSTRVIPPLGCVRAILLAAVWPAAHADQTVLVLALVLAAGATTPPTATAMRLQWRALLSDDDSVSRAYALETVVQVSLFVIGPAAAALGISQVGAGPTLLLSAGTLIVGSVLFGTFARDDRRSTEEPSRSRSKAIRVPGVQTLVGATLLVDAALGMINIAVPAVARQHGHASVAGLALAAFSLTGALAGAAYGARAWRSPARRRLLLITVTAAAFDIPLVFAPSLAWLIGLLAIAGLPVAAQWTTSYLALNQIAPSSGAGEALNWMSAANAAGVAAGESLAGVIIDAGRPRTAFAAAVALVLAGGLILIARRRTLSPAPDRSSVA